MADLSNYFNQTPQAKTAPDLSQYFTSPRTANQSVASLSMNKNIKAGLSHPLNPLNPNSQQNWAKLMPKSGIKNALGGIAGDIGTGISQTAQSLGNPIIGGAKEVANDTSQAFQGGISQIKQGASQFGQGGDIIGPSLNIGAGAVNAALSPLAAPFKPVSKVLQTSAEGYAGIPAVQKFAQSKAGQVTSQALEPIANAGTIAQGALLGAEVPKIKTAVNTGIDLMNKGGDIIQKQEAAASQARAEVSQAKANVKSSAIAGKVVQGDIKDVPKAQKALTQIDTKGIKTYQDLGNALDKKITQVAQLQDKALGTRPETINLQDLTSNGHNFVNDAIQQIKDFFTKTNDVQGLKDITALENKANTKGLTIKEVNDLARQHGQKLNAYNANGELASGLSKQAAENTRQGLKSTVRTFMGDKALQGSDTQLSNLIQTKDLVNTVAEKVNTLAQKIQQRGLLGKIGYGIGKIVDTATGHALKNFVNYFIPRGEGLKTLNALDLQAQLAKNLKALQSLADGTMSNADFTSQLNDLIKKGNPQKLLPSPKAGTPKVSNEVPISQPSKIITNSAETTNISRSRVGIKPKYIKGGGKVTNIGPD